MSNTAQQLSKSNEWYTPAKYIDSARLVMDSTIDLDPASCATANKTVHALTYFDITRDGLSLEWFGNVWLNPPYGRETIKWVNKAIMEYNVGRVNQCIILVNANTETEYFQKLLKYPICFTSRRIRFVDENGVKKVNPVRGNAFIYLGHNCAGFADEFTQWGSVINCEVK